MTNGTNDDTNHHHQGPTIDNSVARFGTETPPPEGTIPPSDSPPPQEGPYAEAHHAAQEEHHAVLQLQTAGGYPPISFDVDGACAGQVH